MKEKDLEKTRSRGPRRLLAVVAILGVVIASVGYGILAQSRRLFPYMLIKHGYQTLLPRKLTRRLAGKPSNAPDAVQRLVHFPYLRGYRPPKEGGVIRAYDRTLAQDGLNFFTSGHAPAAILMDMDAKLLKTWTADSRKAFPGLVFDKKQEAETIV
jgi:hypothetical protein